MQKSRLCRYLIRLGTIAGLAIGLSASEAGATAIDLTTTGSSAVVTAAVGGQFGVIQISPQSTGSGVVDSFLRINSNDDTESGYNTDANQVLDNVGGGFTHSILLSAIPTITINGTVYREFFLDINQTNASPLQSLNQLQIFTAGSDPGGNFTPDNGTDPTVVSVTGATERFRMSSAANPYDLQLNYSLNPGSGSGDYRFFINNNVFAGLDPATTYFILYAMFGTPPGAYGETDGFEEFFTKLSVTGPTPFDVNPVPEPASLLLLGTGLSVVARRAFRKTA